MYKKDNTLLLGKRFDIKPFEDVSKIEHICNKNDCGLFLFGLIIYFLFVCVIDNFDNLLNNLYVDLIKRNVQIT